MIITTHKQFPNYKRYEIEYEGRPLVLEMQDRLYRVS